MSYEDLERPLTDVVNEDLDQNIRLLTDDERLHWIARVPLHLVNHFVHLYHRAEVTNDRFLMKWLDIQLKLRVSIDGRRTSDLIETMKIRMEAVREEAEKTSPPVPEAKGSRPRRLGF
jgi:hypothetical protein